MVGGFGFFLTKTTPVWTDLAPIVEIIPSIDFFKESEPSEALHLLWNVEIPDP